MPGGLETRAGKSAAERGRAAMMKKSLFLGVAAILAGCATIPDGPGVLVLPGSTKSFDQFRADDGDCRQYATAAVGGKSAQQAANQSAATTAAVGTAVGAAAGALIGGNAAGAGVGAGIGLLGGSAIGADSSYSSGRTTQQRYDHAYQQCMYAKGHQVPVARGTLQRQVQSRPSTSAATPPPPPPPPGTPPPPPEGYRVN